MISGKLSPSWRRRRAWRNERRSATGMDNHDARRDLLQATIRLDVQSYEGREIKYLRTTDISGGRIDWHTVPFCEEIPGNIEKYRVQLNDILVSRAGSVGVSYRISDVPCDVVFASYLIRFKPLADIQPKWVEMFLRSDSYWRSISEFSAGIAVP